MGTKAQCFALDLRLRLQNKGMLPGNLGGKLREALPVSEYPKVALYACLCILNFWSHVMPKPPPNSG